MPFTPPEEIQVSLEEQSLTQLKQINAKLGAIQPKLPVSGQIIIAVVNTAIQLPKSPIPNGHNVTIRAPSTNLGTIRLGGSRADVENAAIGFPLVATDPFLEYHIHDLSDLWVAGTSPGDILAWKYEETGS